MHVSASVRQAVRTISHPVELRRCHAALHGRFNHLRRQPQFPSPHCRSRRERFRSSGLLVGAFSLVPFLAPPAKRPILLSFMGTTRGLAVTFGPLIGGALTERASWRWNFYVDLPLGVFIFAVLLATVRPPKRQSEGFTSWAYFFETLDLFGVAALAPSVVRLLLALQWGGTRYPSNDGRIVALFVLFGVLGLVFIMITLEIRHGSKAMLPMCVFAQRAVDCANFYGFWTAGAIFVLRYLRLSR